MNYRHAFHAGNFADVLKHVVLLAIIDALQRKPTPAFYLDTHAGRGRYPLDSGQAQRTGEAREGVLRIDRDAGSPAVKRYRAATRSAHASPRHYPGSPLLLAERLRPGDRLVACELQSDEFGALDACISGSTGAHAEQRDGYAAMRALLPPAERRGLVLVDPPYEAQAAEFDLIIGALRDSLKRWPLGIYAIWFPVKRRSTLAPFLRRAAALPTQSTLMAELLVRPDNSPLRMNGSAMLILNPPWKLDQELAVALPVLREKLGEAGASSRLEWLRKEGGAPLR